MLFRPLVAVAGLLLASVPRVSAAFGGPSCLSFTNSAGSHALIDGGKQATILVDPTDWPGVLRAAGDLQSDLQKVTGQKPRLVNVTASTSLAQYAKPTTPILIGTLGKSALIDQVVNHTSLNLSSIKGKWEANFVQLVNNPLPGIDAAYVIIGSDKRGTIFGIYSLSEEAGVSPWYYWADVQPHAHNSIYVLANASCSRGEPTVQYRGIFLNDEQPSLTNWAQEKFTNGTGPPFNHQFYSTIFELLLRLKGNFLWPAMWNSAFAVDDPVNQYTADLYGIVMGTSHQEPMARASPPEWSMFGSGPWNWDHNTANLTAFWTAGVKRAAPYETMYTVGMRGSGDLPLDESGNIDLLQRVVAAQRTILTTTLNKTAETIPQVWALYKEVQGYYERGMRVPDDVILLWADDNWGNIRRLPTADERARTGGAGIYYHFDYVGDPRDYKWGNSHELAKFHHQLGLAKDYGATKMWIVNVGDLKPHEFSINFFLDYAYNTTTIGKDDLDKYRLDWATREFNRPDLSPQIADVVKRFSKLNSRKKHELINSTTYSHWDYREAENVLAEWQSIYDLSLSLSKKLDSKVFPSYFELVHHPVEAGFTVQDLYISAGRNQLYASQARASVNALADHVEERFEHDWDLQDQYNKISNGKWDHTMDQTHLGYYYWQQPMLNTMPSITRVQKKQEALAGAMRVTVENSQGAWPGDNPSQCAQGYNCPPPSLLPLTPFNPLGSRYLTISAGGPNSFDFAITTNVTWLTLTPSSGSVSSKNQDVRVLATVDWSKFGSGTQFAALTIKPTKGQTVMVYQPASNLQVSGFSGFVEDDGVVSIEAQHTSANTTVGQASWEVLPDYGKTLSAVSPRAPVDSRWDAGQGPALQYNFYTFNSKSGFLTATVYTAPSLNTFPGHFLKYAIQVDNGTPQVVQPMPDAPPGTLPGVWGSFVADEIVRTTTNHTASPGAHTLKIYAMEIGLVIEKIVIESASGGLKYSYLGPTESKRV